jgi:hypothetical protein
MHRQSYELEVLVTCRQQPQHLGRYENVRDSGEGYDQLELSDAKTSLAAITSPERTP